MYKLDPWRTIITLMFLILFTSFLLIEYKGILCPNEVGYGAWFWYGAVSTIIILFLIYFTWKYDHKEDSACCLAYERSEIREARERMHKMKCEQACINIPKEI